MANAQQQQNSTITKVTLLKAIIVQGFDRLEVGDTVEVSVPIAEQLIILKQAEKAADATPVYLQANDEDYKEPVDVGPFATPSQFQLKGVTEAEVPLNAAQRLEKAELQLGIAKIEAKAEAEKAADDAKTTKTAK